MRSKQADGIPNAKQTHGAAPKLRFPEFDGGWASSLVSELYSFKGNNSLSREKLNYESGPVRNIHYGDIHTKFSPRFRVSEEVVPYVNEGESHSSIRPDNYCVAGDMVFADASEDTNDIGKAIEIVDAGDVPLVSGLHTILAKPIEASFATGFGAYLFSSEGVRRQIQREGQGAKVLGISTGRLGTVQLRYPREVCEQQKISDCLSSLDTVIGAEARKLDALKAHKQSLMQQLFPTDGKRMPRLRFPGFDGEWELCSVGDIMQVGSSKRVHESDWAASGVPFYRAREIVALAEGFQIAPLFIEETLYAKNASLTGEVRPGHLLVTGVGSIGVPYLVRAGDRFYFKDGNIIWLKNDETILLGSFLHRAYLTPSVQGQITMMAGVGTVGTYTIDSAKKTEIRFPSAKEEQQTISNCLSSLDDLAAAQSNKIAALQQHKSGLMQGLFSALDA